MKLFHMICPACGAAIENNISGRIVTCAYCDSRFVIDGEGGSFADDLMRPHDDPGSARLPMPQFAAAECQKFLEDNDYGDHFESTAKILRGLGVGDEDVYLIHDDTLFHSGKNGFAITERGIYCRDMAEKPQFFPWEEFARMEDPVDTDAHITCNNKLVCYFTDDSDIFEELVVLYQKLHRHAKSFA